MKKKIMFVHGNSDIIGGQEISLSIRIKGLKTKGIQSLVTVPEEGEFSELLQENNIEVRFIQLNRLSRRNPFPYLKTVFRLFKLIKKEQVAVVNASGAYPVQYCLPAARLSRVPCVAHINNTVYSKGDLRKSFVGLLDGVIAVSNAVKEDILNKIKYDASRIKVIYNPVSNNKFFANVGHKELKRLKSTYGIGNNFKVIGQIGQIIPRKGLECFVQMAQRIKQENPRVKFMVVGKAPLRKKVYDEKIQSLVKKYGLTKNFIFTGFQKDTAKFIALLDICVNCSFAEGGPRIVAEAMAMGKPVLTTSVGFAPEIIKNDVNGYVFTLNQPQSMAEMALKLLSDKDKREKISRNAQKTIDKLFSIDYHNRVLSKFYHQIINKNRPPLRKKINILYYDPSSGYGGAGNALVYLLTALNKTEYSPFVVVLHDGPQFEKIKTLGLSLCKIRNRSLNPRTNNKFISYFHFVCDFLFNTLPLTLNLAFIIKKDKINLVHINTNIILGIPAILATKLLGIPCLCHLRETRRIVRSERVFSGWINQFIVLNNDAYVQYKKFIPARKLAVVYDGIDLSGFAHITTGNFRKESGLNSNPLVAVIGRIVQGKGHKEFIRAAKEVLKTKPKVKFIIVGAARGGKGKYYQEVKALVRNERLEKSVIFTGWRNDIANLVADFDILVLPSTTYPEGLPNTLIEAMALKKPVIASSIPGPMDIVAVGKTGILVPPGDIKALGKSIIYLLDRPGIARQIGEEARKRVEKLFNIQKQAVEIENLYKRLLQMK